MKKNNIIMIWHLHHNALSSAEEIFEKWKKMKETQFYICYNE